MDKIDDGGPAYGIIDPDYARVFTKARCIAWAEGYALMMHGSFTRDLDLLAVPWRDGACEPQHLINRVVASDNLRSVKPDGPSKKPHGRLVWTLTFTKFGDPRFIDFGVMPRGDDYDRGRRDMLNAILALNPEAATKVADAYGQEPDAEGRLPFSVVLWVTMVAQQLGIEPIDAARASRNGEAE